MMMMVFLLSFDDRARARENKLFVDDDDPPF